MSDKFCPDDKDKNSLAQKDETFYLLFHKLEVEDKFNDSDYLNLHLWCYEYDIEKKQMADKRRLAQIISFPAYLCIKLPENITHLDDDSPAEYGKDAKFHLSDEEFDWDDDLADQLYYNLTRLVTQKERANGNKGPFYKEFDFFYEIYHYQACKDKPYMYLYFRNIEDKNKLKSKLRNPVKVKTKKNHVDYAVLEVHEEKISVFDRLLSKRKFKNFTSWFKVKGRNVPWGSQYRIANENCSQAYINYDTIEDLPLSETKMWIPKVRKVAFDLETYSHLGVKKFPDPSDPRDPIFIATVDFIVNDDQSTRKTYCLCLGKPKKLKTNAEVIRMKDEPSLLIALIRLLTYLDGDYIITHNGYMFDNPYVVARFDVHKIAIKDIPNFGRIMNYTSRIYENNWSSSGYGKTSTMFLVAPGVCQCDTLPIFKRLAKLKMYSLKFLAELYLPKEAGKKEMTAEKLFDAYRSYINDEEGHEDKMTEVVEYGIRDSVVVNDLFNVRHVFPHFFALSGQGRLFIEDIYMGGEQRRCYANLAFVAQKKKYILQNSKLYDTWCAGGRVTEPKKGKHSKVGTVDFSSLYPSIIQAYNLCYTTFIPIEDWPNVSSKNYRSFIIIQDEPESHFSSSRKMDILKKIQLRKSGYEVIITKEELEYANRKTEVLESVKQSETEGYTTDEDSDSDDDEEDTPKKKKKNEKTVKRQYEMRFVTKECKPGIFPTLQADWVTARKAVKKEMKGLEVEKSVNEEKIKIINNSIEALMKSMEGKEDEIKELLGIEILDLEKSKEELIQDYQDKLDYCMIEMEKIDLNEKLEKSLKKLKIYQECSQIFNLTPEEIQKIVIEMGEEIEKLTGQILALDKKQNSIKIVANAGYGFTGVRTGMLSGIFIAMCVTYLGRKHIGEANDVILKGSTAFTPEEKEARIKDYNEKKKIVGDVPLFKLDKYYKDLTDEVNANRIALEYLQISLYGFECLDADIVYNDTDSSMVNMNVDLTNDLERIGKYLTILISGCSRIELKCGVIVEAIPAVFQKPLVMEFENWSVMIAIKCKYYIKIILETDPEKIEKYGIYKLDKNGKPEIMRKGVLSAKKGSSLFSKTVYDDLSDKILYDAKLKDIFESLSANACKLLTGGFGPETLTKVTEMGSNYKNKNYYMAVFSRYLKKMGKPIQPGERVEYIIVKTKKEIEEGGKIKVGKKCREINMWTNDDDREEIDYQYYIEKGLQKQYDDLFYVGNNKICDSPDFERLGYQPIFSTCHFVHFSKPIKMLAAIVKDYLKPDYKIFKMVMNDQRGIKTSKKVPRWEYIAMIIKEELKRIRRKIYKFIEVNEDGKEVFVGELKEVESELDEKWEEAKRRVEEEGDSDKESIEEKYKAESSADEEKPKKTKSKRKPKIVADDSDVEEEKPKKTKKKSKVEDDGESEKKKSKKRKPKIISEDSD